MPIVAKAPQSASSAIAPRNDSPGRVMNEIGYAVNHTDAVSTAWRGPGLANGFCHIVPWPENWRLISLASASIDWASSHDTYAGLVPVGLPSLATERRATGALTRARWRRLRGRAGWKCSA